MLIPAIRFVAAKGSKAWGGSIQLRCHVKPGVNVNREGIRSVTDEHIEVCVAAQVNEGEANKAVTKVIADVLDVPKSDVEIVKGAKSREKTIAISNITLKDTTDNEIKRIKIILLKSVD